MTAALTAFLASISDWLAGFCDALALYSSVTFSVMLASWLFRLEVAASTTFEVPPTPPPHDSLASELFCSWKQ